jgi:hypothetical protein
MGRSANVLGINSLRGLLAASFRLRVSLNLFLTTKKRIDQIKGIYLSWRVSVSTFNMSVHCLWYSSKPSAKHASWAICSTYEYQSPISDIKTRHTYIRKRLLHRKRFLTSLSKMLFIPIWAKWRDSANFSSAWRISSSVTEEPTIQISLHSMKRHGNDLSNSELKSY